MTTLWYSYLLLSAWWWNGTPSEGAVPPHDFHASMAEIAYSPESKAFQMSLRVFTDDMEDAIRPKAANSRITLSNKSTVHDAALLAYVQKNCYLSSNKEKLGLWQWVGKEVTAEVVWLYVELPYKGNFKDLSLTYKVMFELFDDQVNMANVKTRQGSTKTYVFKAGKPSTQTLQW
ncbi:DUF6702 family protein [Eisenibacter elegans]|jgi:hypothetical protein|uniref:DUF6702 family protein n=1 Tax=Eisenibacter elegans TaxID=997 RepID=UPI0012B54D1F|nr:DUF6702 family protein [Eisenibacter elegans]